MLVKNEIAGDGNVGTYVKEYAAYLDGLEGIKKQNLAQIYHNINQNKSHSLFESWNTGTASTGLDTPIMTGALPQTGMDPTLGGQFAPIVFALSRFTFPNLIGNEICGVQALPGPVGQAFCVKFRMQDQDIQDGAQPMANWQEVPDYVGYSGASKGTKSTGFSGWDTANAPAGTSGWGQTISPESLELAGAMPTLGITSGTFEAGAAGQTGAASDLYKTQGAPGQEYWGITKNWGNLDIKTPELTFDMGLVTIETKDRHLAASFNVKTQMYAKYMQGFDVERELFNAVHYHVLAEIDRETLLRARYGAYRKSTGTVPSPNSTAFFDTQYKSQSDYFTYTVDCMTIPGTWSQQLFAGVINQIVRAANDLARRNHRGAGNFCVVSPNIATILQQSGEWFSGTNVNVNASSVVPEIGTINGSIKVFCDRYAKDDVVLVGYKGPGVADAGLIFGPFSMGLELRAISPNDFATRIGVLSQYGFVNNLLGSDLYYSTIAFANVESLWFRAQGTTTP